MIWVSACRKLFVRSSPPAGDDFEALRSRDAAVAASQYARSYSSKTEDSLKEDIIATTKKIYKNEKLFGNFLVY